MKQKLLHFLPLVFLALMPTLLAATIPVMESAAAKVTELGAAPTTAPAGTPDPSLDAKCNANRNDLYGQILAAAENQLTNHPPAYPMPPERQLALLALDGVMNDPYVIERPPLQEYFHHRFKLALNEIQTAKVPAGQTRIWQIYNMGFIVKTSSTTMAFDLIAPSHLPGLEVPSDLMRAMVEQCDVLFISHLHQDHADPVVAKMFAEAGKPILGPAELVTIDPIYNKVLPLKPDAEKSYDVQLAKTKLSVQILPGQQEIKRAGLDAEGRPIFVQVNVYVVRTAEGFVIAHIGDQNDLPSWSWIDKLHTHIPHVDVLIYNVWENPIGRYVKGFSPSMIIMAHTNELGHTIAARYPYWKAVSKGEKAKIPFMVMAWGESITYPLTR